MGINRIGHIAFLLTCYWVSYAQNFYPIVKKDNLWFHEVVIKEGTTLFSLMQEFGLSTEEIKQDNPGITDQLKTNGKILLRAKRSTFDYTVKKGDTPYGVSSKFGIPLDSLYTYNEAIRVGGVKIGQHLQISQGIKRVGYVATEIAITEPVPGGSDSLISALRTFEFSDSILEYRVRQGEKLSDISKRFLVSTEKLKSFNGLKNSTISDGMLLKIPLRVNEVVPIVPSLPDPIKTPNYSLQKNQKTLPFQPTVKSTNLKIGVFLPFNRDSIVFPLKGYQKFAFDFYMGVMTGLDSLKNLDLTGDLYFFDYQSKEESIDQLIRSGKIDRFDMFIGPMHPVDCEKLSVFSAEKGIPLILPLPLTKMSQQMINNEQLFMIASELSNQISMLGKFLGESSLDKQVVLYQTGLASDTTLERQFIRDFYNHTPKNVRLILANESMLKAFSKATSPVNVVCLSQDKKQVIQVVKLMRSNNQVSLYGLREWTELKEINSLLDNQGVFNYMSTTCFDLENLRVKNFHKAFRASYETDLSKSALLGYDIMYGLVPWLVGVNPMRNGLMTTFDYGKTVQYYHSNLGLVRCRFMNFKHERNDGWK
jgi:LysM repeat protein